MLFCLLFCPPVPYWKGESSETVRNRHLFTKTILALNCQSQQLSSPLSSASHNNCCLLCHLLVILKVIFANSVDPDQTALLESDQGPHCLPVCKNRFEKFARIFSTDDIFRCRFSCHLTDLTPLIEYLFLLNFQILLHKKQCRTLLIAVH